MSAYTHATLERTATVSYDAYVRPTATTDINGRTTTVAYDEYNRVTKVWEDGQPANTPNFKAAYNVNARPAQTTTQILLDGSTYVPTVEYLNGFGQTIQTQTNSPTSGKMWVTPFELDELGRIRYQATQYEASGDPGTAYLDPDWSTVQNYRKHTYLRAGHNITTEQRTDNTVLWETRNENVGWANRQIDPKGRYVDTYYDAFGDLENVREREGTYNSPVYATTHYQFDPAGRLTQANPPGTGATDITYDLLGRKLTLDDPDTGTWKYTYDTNNNLTNQEHVGQTGSTGNITKMVYDDLDRLLETRRGDNTKISKYRYYTNYDLNAVQFEWHYRTNGSTFDTQTLFDTPDSQGRMRRTVEWIRTENPFRHVRLDSRLTYGEAGQVTNIQYPKDSISWSSGSTDVFGLDEYVTVGCDPRTGLPVSMSSADHDYVDSQAYNGAGQPTTRIEGAGTLKTTRTIGYDAATGRIKQLRFETDADLGDVQRYRFTSYDGNGNIIKIKDNTNSSQYQCFTYDQYDRLRNAFTSNNCANGYNSATGDGAYEEKKLRLRRDR